MYETRAEWEQQTKKILWLIVQGVRRERTRKGGTLCY
jgi:hypothetical protein